MLDTTQKFYISLHLRVGQRLARVIHTPVMSTVRTILSNLERTGGDYYSCDGGDRKSLENQTPLQREKRNSNVEVSDPFLFRRHAFPSAQQANDGVALASRDTLIQIGCHDAE